MSSTGIQNYLSNVFRQVYTFDTTAAVFTPSLEISNVNTYSGNAVSVSTAAVGDAASNVYVGSNAGNVYNRILFCSSVTAIGHSAGAGISSVSNSVYLGFRAGFGSSGANAVIAVGRETGGGGTSNIFIGNSTGTNIGSNNIFVGHGISPVGLSNQVRIGMGTKTPIVADLSTNWVGLGGALTPSRAGVTLDVSGVTHSTNGFASVQSDISASIGLTTIGPVKKGIIVVSTVDRATPLNHAAAMFLGTTSSAAVSFGSTVTTSNMSVVVNSGTIQISNTTTVKRCDYSITYFPLP